MNKKRRASISEALFLIDSALKIVSKVSMEECNSLENIPDNLQSSDMYSESEYAVESLSSAEEYLLDAKKELEDIS